MLRAAAWGQKRKRAVSAEHRAQTMPGVVLHKTDKDLQESGKLSIHHPPNLTNRYVPAYCWLRALRHAPLVAASKILPRRHSKYRDLDYRSIT